jgi:hypothetical protein
MAQRGSRSVRSRTRGSPPSSVDCCPALDSRYPPNCYNFPVSDTYRITVRPHFLREGDFKGHMEYVEYIATSGDDTIGWHETNYGQLAESFRRLVPAAIADNLISILHMGDEVTLPGHYTGEQVQSLGSTRQGHE